MNNYTLLYFFNENIKHIFTNLIHFIDCSITRKNNFLKEKRKAFRNW